MDQKVVLVDENDREIGLEDKLKAHQNGGKLHRAISVFIFNDKGKLMMQQRALTKYHGAGLWSSTTCSHPFPGEKPIDAAHRRLKEEMGFDCDLKELCSFIYKAEMENGLTEHEYDHYFVGVYNGRPKINKEEANDWKWMSIKEINEQIVKNNKQFTAFFLAFYKRVIDEARKAGIKLSE
ncbi:MAG: isopentenyl-diphosphate Delta-isomerase [Candidatus Micrarchaeia archaeon]